MLKNLLLYAFLTWPQNEWRPALQHACSTLVLPQVKVSISQKQYQALSLLKPMRETGAYSTTLPSLKLGELRRLQQAWPRSKGEGAQLTWIIQLLLIQK